MLSPQVVIAFDPFEGCTKRGRLNQSIVRESVAARIE